MSHQCHTVVISEEFGLGKRLIEDPIGTDIDVTLDLNAKPLPEPALSRRMPAVMTAMVLLCRVGSSRPGHLVRIGGACQPPTDRGDRLTGLGVTRDVGVDRRRVGWQRG